MYAQEQAQAGQQAGAGTASDQSQDKPVEGEVVDAEFEEVKDKK